MLNDTVFRNGMLGQVMKEQERENAKIQKEYVNAIQKAIKGYRPWWYPFEVTHSTSVSDPIAPFPELDIVANEMKKVGITFDGKREYSGKDLTTGNRATDIYYNPDTKNLHLWDDSDWTGYGY